MSVNNFLQDKKLKYKVLYFLLLTAIIIAIGYKIHLNGEGDDISFYHALDKRSLIEFIYIRYTEWSGRVLLEAIMVSTIKIKLFWKLAIPLSLLLLCYSIYRITLEASLNSYIGVLVAIGFCLLIGNGVKQEAMWWVTGFYNYLLPTSLGVFSLMILQHKDRYSNIYLALSILCLFIACYNEQVVVVIFIVSLLILVVRFLRKAPIKFDLFFVFFTMLNAAVIFLAPGNYHRFVQETITWFPEFHDYTMLQKLTLGIDRINEHLHNRSADKIFQLSFFLLTLLLIKEKSKWKIKLVVISVFALNIVFFWLHFAVKHVWPSYHVTLSPENWSSYGIYASYLMTFITISSLLVSNAYISKNKAELIELSIYPLLGLMTVIMLSFSPTVYASSQRILFLCDILFVMYACVLLRKCIASYCGHKLFSLHRLNILTKLVMR